MTDNNKAHEVPLEEVRWCTAGELADIYKVSQPTIRRWVNQNGIRHIRNSNLLRIDRDDFERYMQSKVSGGREKGGRSDV